jgi:hypothetical protein
MSMARSIAGRAMFFTLIRSRERPDGAVGALDVLAQAGCHRRRR